MADCGRGLFFFFQAEDGIRDYKVTGVQTCALPIYVDRKIRGQDGFAAPFLYDSFIRYNMPVYPGAPRDTPFLPSTWFSPPAAPTRPDEPTIPERGQSRCHHDAYQEKRTEKRVSLN